MKNLLQYLKIILSETSTQITGIIGFTLLLIISQIPDIGGNNQLTASLIVILICFILSHYKVIVKLINNNRLLDKKIAEFEQIKSDFGFDVKFKKHDLSEREKYYKDELEWVNKQIQDAKNSTNPNYSGLASILYSNFSPFSRKITEEDLQEYKKKIEDLVRELNKINNHRLYNLSIVIKNNSHQFEEEIKAAFSTEDGFFKFDYELPLDQIYDSPERPRSDFMPHFFERNIPFNPVFEKPINKIYLTKKDDLEIEVPKLHAGNELTLEDEDIFLLVSKSIKKVVFNIKVNSLLTKSPLEITSGFAIE